MCRCGDVAHKHSMKASLGSEQNHIFQLSRREESRCYVILIKCRRVKQTFHQLSLMKFTKLPEWMCERMSSKANQPPNNSGNNVVEHVAMERWWWVILATEKLSFHQKFKIFSYCYKHELSKLFLIKINKVELEDNEEDKLMFSIMFTQIKYNKNHIFYFLYIYPTNVVRIMILHKLSQSMHCHTIFTESGFFHNVSNGEHSYLHRNIRVHTRVNNMSDIMLIVASIH